MLQQYAPPARAEGAAGQPVRRELHRRAADEHRRCRRARAEGGRRWLQTSTGRTGLRASPARSSAAPAARSAQPASSTRSASGRTGFAAGRRPARGLPARVVSNQWLGDQSPSGARSRRLLPASRSPHRRIDAGGRRAGARSTCRRRRCICSTPPAARRCARPRRGGRGGMSARRHHRRRRRHLGDQGRGLRPRRRADRASAARPNRYVDLPGGGVEQDMARDLGRHGGGAARAGRARAGLPRRAAALAVTGQGDGTWLIDADGRAGGARLAVARFARGRRSSASCDAAACARDLPVHRLRPERLQPVGPSGLAQAPRARAAGPRRHRLPLQGLALFQAHRRARHRHLRRHVHLRRLPHPRLCAGGAGALGLADRERAAACDDRRQPGDPSADAPLLPRPPACPRACRSCWAIWMCSAPAWAAGIYEPGQRHRLLDRRLDRHAHALRARCARALRLGAGAGRLHHAVPGAGQRQPRCSRTWRPR